VTAHEVNNRLEDLTRVQHRPSSSPPVATPCTCTCDERFLDTLGLSLDQVLAANFLTRLESPASRNGLDISIPSDGPLVTL
jgi:hypothetical protein